MDSSRGLERLTSESAIREVYENAVARFPQLGTL